MRTARVDLAIVVVNWNTRELLAQVLESVYAAADGLSLEIVVVDNASHDGSADMVRNRFPAVHLVENATNVGFARANNQAVHASRGELILLLNSDTIVQPGALAHLVAFMQAHPEAGIVGANVRNGDGTPQRCYGRFPNLLTETATIWGLDTRPPFAGWLNPQQDLGSEAIQADWVMGAALVIRRAAFLQAGQFDPGYFMYSEEVDLARAVKQAGWHTYVLGSARIVHLGQQSNKHLPALMKAQLLLSKIRYFRKHQGRLVAAAIWLVFGTSILVKQYVYGLAGRHDASRLWAETARLYYG